MAGIKILQVLVILGIFGVIFYLLQLSTALNLEKRIANFAITPKKVEEVSLFDKIKILIWKIIRKIGNILNKSVVLSKYGDKYNKYIYFQDKNKRSGIDYVALKIVILIVALILSLITLAYQDIHFNLFGVIGIILISFFIPDVVLKISYNKKRKQIEEDLLKAIIIMNNAFQSGRNIMQAVEVVNTELDGPIADEFKKIYLDISYGLSLDVVFERFYERVRLEDAKYITSSLTLLNKTGGDIVKVFSIIEKTFLAKKNLKNELDSLTVSSKFVFKLLIMVPLVFVAIIFILNPSYFKPLFTSVIGIIILIIIGLLYGLYILIVKRILEVSL